MIDLNVETIEKTAGESLTKNNKITSKTTKDLIENGLSSKEISTEELQIQKDYKSEYNNNTK